jgi:hypothetical protein
MSKTYADYIKLKVITSDLCDQKRLPAIISSNKYTLYKGYAVENCTNTTTPTFTICNGTNLRPNRVLFTHQMFDLDESPKYKKNVDNISKFRNKCKFQCISKVNI